MSRVVLVALPVPALDVLSYAVPENCPYPDIGTRVLVPLGQRVLTGCVVGRSGDSHISAGVPLKPLLEVLDVEPLLPVEVIELARWVAEYYVCGLGEAIAAAMPPRAWIVSGRQVEMTDAGREALKANLANGRRNVLELLSRRKSWSLAKLSRELAAGRRSPASGRTVHSMLRALTLDGLVRITQPLKGKGSAFKSTKVVRLTTNGLELLECKARLGKRQREALTLLREMPHGTQMSDLVKRGIPAGTLRRLLERGGLTIDRQVIERLPWASDTFVSGATPESSEWVLTSAQAAAVESLEASASKGDFGVTLLHGVTGSGKTEVYVRVARTVVASKRQVLILVPEIALTPAVASSFRRVFGSRVAVQHSGLSEGVRHDQWYRIRRGDVDVVVGTRSAVFAPLPTLGLIVVDEEHDGSYKQEESPRYHGRDVAIMRGKRCGAWVVLGSATPSLESYQHTANGRYQRVTLPNRIHRRSLPTVRVVDMRKEFAEQGPDAIFSGLLARSLDERLRQREQVLLLLNRRGFASAVLCRQCGCSLECPNCSVSLTFHQASDRAQCHYCGYSRARPTGCPECGGSYLEQVGIGTQKVEAEIRQRWPEARVARLDRDTTQRKGTAARVLGRLASGELDVLVGTQMVAKGHDFPRVTLVGVVSADLGLGVADFRAAERTFQLLTQVAGRAGRGERPGEAIIQTLYPDHYSIRYACSQAYGPFFEEELRFRRAMRYPPQVRLVCAVIRGKVMEQALRDAGELAARLRRRRGQFTVLGPAAAPIGKLRGRYRAQLFLKGPYRHEMRVALLECLRGQPELNRRVVIDVDPLSML